MHVHVLLRNGIWYHSHVHVHVHVHVCIVVNTEDEVFQVVILGMYIYCVRELIIMQEVSIGTTYNAQCIS